MIWTSWQQKTRVTEQQFVQIRKLTKQDSQLQALKVTILGEIPLCIREYWSCRDKLAVHNEVIVRGKGRAIIPKVLQPKMLTRIHASHLGAETCLRKARDVKYQPTMNSALKYFIINCPVCNHYLQKKPAKNH